MALKFRSEKKIELIMSEVKFIYREESYRPPVKGDCLISEPMQREPFFSRSVALLIDKDSDDSYLGLILNHKLPFSMGDVFRDISFLRDMPLYSGGPVETDRLFVLHTLGARIPGSREVTPGLYVGGELSDLFDYIAEGNEVEGKIRFFLGYSGWGDHQLEMEMRSHYWTLLDSIKAEDAITGNGYEYWCEAVGSLGEKYRSWLIVPPDDHMN